jgi:hypothetical protein
MENSWARELFGITQNYTVNAEGKDNKLTVGLKTLEGANICGFELLRGVSIKDEYIVLNVHNTTKSIAYQSNEARIHKKTIDCAEKVNLVIESQSHATVGNNMKSFDYAIKVFEDNQTVLFESIVTFHEKSVGVAEISLMSTQSEKDAYLLMFVNLQTVLTKAGEESVEVKSSN